MSLLYSLMVKSPEPHWVDFARTAHWFDITAIDQLPNEITDFGDEMTTRGLIDPPYNKTCYFSKCYGTEYGIAAVFDRERDEVLLFLFVAIRPLGYLKAILRRDGYTHFESNASHYSEDQLEALTVATGLYMKAQSALLAKDCPLVRCGPNDRRIERDIKQGRIPGVVWHTVTLGPSAIARINGSHGTGERLSPRLHWRRGHFRDLSGGDRSRLIPIPPMLVGSKDRGLLIKDYKIK